MNTVQEIEYAVKSLDGKAMDKFRKWFYLFDEKAWDKKVILDQRDENSPIAKLARRALISNRSGKSKAL